MPASAVSLKDSGPGTKPFLRAGSIVALVLLLPPTFMLALGASLIPFRFHVGKNRTLVFAKMLMPAFVWPLCWLGALCAVAGLALGYFFWRNRRRIGFASALALVVAIANVVVCVMAARTFIAALLRRASRSCRHSDVMGLIAYSPARRRGCYGIAGRRLHSTMLTRA